MYRQEGVGAASKGHKHQHNIDGREHCLAEHNKNLHEVMSEKLTVSQSITHFVGTVYPTKELTLLVMELDRLDRGVIE